ncbi:haloalkane dehalogenase [Variovorax sp. PBS-H4]|uniref:alpha/beta fold hydrolase n=1 Tax=Variovorax sp. PBS-H4 TaxID=434008 RepID=UPI0013184302|nr:alpha/beta fold hydrolase [Variovorax sp. PBS-H4]VTU34351.1 haloalkane dehalogenase [Variovorax sp. PBS-H4]
MQRRSLMAAALAAPVVARPAATAAVETKRTFVLQHGAWHGGWCWVRVADRLRAQGHSVFTPTATGLGERAHLLSRDITVDVFVTDLAAMIEAEELKDVVLVGHSFGGLAITGAADRVKSRLRRLVYLDAAILQPGQSILDSMPPEIAAQRRETIRAGGGISLPVPPASYFGISEPSDTAWLQRRLTPHPAVSYDSPLTLRAPVGNGVPATYIGCTVNPLASIEPMRQWARTQAAAGKDWTYEQLPSVHNAMMTVPELLTQSLLRLASL